jgi:CheY-like chemotaxis protein
VARASTFRMLLVDGDLAMRLAIARMLEALGGDVLAVGIGDETLRIIDRGFTVEALVVDVAQARVGDRSVARAVTARWPRARLVFTARELSDLLPDATHAQVLVRPFGARDLAHALGRDQPR